MLKEILYLFSHAFSTFHFSLVFLWYVVAISVHLEISYNINLIIKCLNQTIVKINLIICVFVHLHLINIKRKIWTWTGIRTRTSRPLVWRSSIELSWFLFQFTFKLSSWNVCHFYKTVWSIYTTCYLLIIKQTNFAVK